MAGFDFSNPANIQLASALEQDRGLPQGALFAVAQQESGGNPNAISPAGAHGLMQFMPATAKQYNVDTSSPFDSLRGAADMLGDLTKQYGGSFPAALAHYNGGTAQGQLVANGHAPTLPETANYVPQVLARMGAQDPSQTQAAPAQPPAPSIPPAISNQVAALKLHGADTDDIFHLLLADPTQGPLVKDAFYNQNVPKDQIVKIAGGQALQAAQATIDKVGQRSALDRFMSGGLAGLQDVGHGIGQLVDRATGDNAALAQDQQAQAQREADPERAALLSTTAGSIGHGLGQSLPALAAVPFTDGGSLGLLAGGAAGGALAGATTPTTAPGQIAPNIGGGALGGALGGAAGAIGGKVLGSLAGSDGALAGRLSAANELAPGEVAMSDVPGAAQSISLAAHNIPFAGGQSLDSIAGKQNYIIQRGLMRAFDPRVTDGVDLSASKLTPDVLSGMKSNIQNMYSNLNGVSVKIDPAQLAPLTQTLQDAQGTGVMAGLQDLSKPATAIANLQKAAASGQPIPLTELQQVSSALKNDVQYNPSADSGARVVAKNVTDGLTQIINDSLAAQDPALGTIYTDANRAYAMHKLIEDLSGRTAQGEKNITPTMLQTSMRAVYGKPATAAGTTPFSPMAIHVQNAFGDASSKLGKIMGSALDNTAGHIGGVTALFHSPHIALPAMALGRAVTGVTDSTSPFIQSLFTGSNALGSAVGSDAARKALASALIGAGSQVGN